MAPFDELFSELQERVMHALGGWCLLAAPTCRAWARHAAAMKQEGREILALPRFQSDGMLRLSGEPGFSTVTSQGPLDLGGGQSRWAFPKVYSNTLETVVYRVGGGPAILRRTASIEQPNAWSFFKAVVELPVDASFSFELRVGACEGRETKISLMREVILRKGDGGWNWCRWRGGFQDLVPARVADNDGAWHVITQLVTKDGVMLFEDGRLVLDWVCEAAAPAIPTLDVQHLDGPNGHPLWVEMRHTSVCLAAGADVHPTGEEWSHETEVESDSGESYDYDEIDPRAIDEMFEPDEDD